MPILQILRFPDPRLRKVAATVDTFDDALHALAQDMAETMYAAPGIGLAATQVDVCKRLIVIDCSETKDELIVLVNPELVKSEGAHIVEEGCLSVPGIYDKVERAEEVMVNYFDLNGNAWNISANGLLAVCLQHEIEHLTGQIFVDHLSLLKQDRIKTKMTKQVKKCS